MKKITIGYSNPRDYGLEKILCKNPPKEIDLKFVVSPTGFILSRLGKGLVYPKILFPIPIVSLIHTYNSPILNRIPWIISFESNLPYFSERESPILYRLSIKALKSNCCKKLLPTSKNACEILQDKPFFDELMKKKIEIVNYGYPEIYKHRCKKDKKGILNILFVGHLFFLKGGDLLLYVFNSIKKDFNVELTIISRVSSDRWFTKTTKSDEERAKENLINSSQVTWIKDAPYEEIIERFFLNADIFVLPSWSETWGHVLCEAISAGLPIISTRIRAIPEIINHKKNGYLINVPVDKHGVLFSKERDKSNPMYFKNAMRENKKLVEDQLKQYLISLLENEELRKSFGRKSRELFENKFSYSVRNKKLLRIYREILE